MPQRSCKFQYVLLKTTYFQSKWFQKSGFVPRMGKQPQVDWRRGVTP